MDFAGTVFGSAAGGNPVTGMLTYLPMMLIITGAMLFASGWKHRKGTESRCAQCGYQRMPGSSAAAQEKCPECAAAWNQVGGITHGVTSRQPRVMFAGGLCAVVGLFLISSQFTLGFDALAKAMPTSILIDQVASGSGFTKDEWAELRTRDLSREQTIALAEAILERRLREGFLWADDDNWFAAQITAKSLPAELIERYYAEALELSLSAPEQARVGEPLHVLIDGTARVAFTKNPAPIVLIAGFFVGDGPEPVQGLPHPIHGSIFGSASQRPADAPPMSRPGVPSLELTPQQPGPLRIRLECWIAFVPPGGNVTVTWNTDGSPVTPPGCVHLEHRMLEHVVAIKP